MKKWSVALALVLGMCLPHQTVLAEDLMTITHEAGYTEALEMNKPKASIVIDAKTGSILWGENIDEQRDPASMSKMLALFLVYEAMEQGKFGLDTVVTATETDQAMGKLWEISNNNIVAGVGYTVEELIIATLVPSSNVATLMLANLVEPDPDAFIDLQNAKAKELGMTSTTFYNATGAVARAFGGYYAPKRHDNYTPNVTTARDYATLTYHFINRFPGILDYTHDSKVTIKQGTPYEETFKSYNYSLPDGKYGIEGVTGLKTGSSPSAGFNITATAKRGEQELIAVLMGVGHWSDQNGEYYRHPFTNALLEKAFADYDYQLVAKAGKQTISDQKVTLEEDLYATVKTGETPKLVYQEDHVSVDNGLETVNPAIAEEQEVAAKPAGFFNFGTQSASKTEAASKSAKSVNWLTLGGAVGLAVLGLGAILLILEKKARQDRRQSKRRR
ncbi:D-alanyl-D-alanine carboxypeptidase family protein [Streptococcus ovuberis]